MKNQMAACILALGMAAAPVAFAQEGGATPSTDVNVNVQAPAQQAPAPSTTNIEVDAPAAPAAPAVTEKESTTVKETNTSVVQTPAPAEDTNWALIIGLGIVGLVVLGALIGSTNRATA